MLHSRGGLIKPLVDGNPRLESYCGSKKNRRRKRRSRREVGGKRRGK
jgi:hypothetical protein